MKTHMNVQYYMEGQTYMSLETHLNPPPTPCQKKKKKKKKD